MTIKVSIGINTSDAAMSLESQKVKGLMDPQNMLPRSAPTKLSKDEDISAREREGFALMAKHRAQLFSPEELEKARRVMEEIMSGPPQDGKKFLRLAGIVEERISPENTQPCSAEELEGGTGHLNMAGKAELDNLAEMLEDSIKASKYEEMARREREAIARLGRDRARMFSPEELEEADRLMEEIMSRPQNGTKFLRLIGIVEERITPE
jgi:hypothetical protein